MSIETLLNIWNQHETLKGFSVRYDGTFVDPDGDEVERQDLEKALQKAETELAAFKAWVAAAAQLPKWSSPN
jgi:hypothetical protein